MVPVIGMRSAVAITSIRIMSCIGDSSVFFDGKPSRLYFSSFREREKTDGRHEVCIS
jgi:hypothetical protein